METDSPEVVAVQPSGQLPQDGVVGIRGNPFDNQLIPCDAQREGPALLQQPIHAFRHTSRCRSQRRMIRRVHGVLVDCDRKLNQAAAQFM